MYSQTLYGADKSGSIKEWTISVVCEDGNAHIKLVHGKVGGKLQEKLTVVPSGKQGRSAIEQAELEARAKVKKNLDKGYRENKNDLEELPLIAMLAGDYNKIGHRIEFPCLVSDKFDGVRCLAKCTERGIVTLESRTGQPYYLPHITAQLIRTMNPGEVFDGEIYLHGYALQDITSAVKRTETQDAIDKAQRKLGKVVVEGDLDAIAEAHRELEEANLIHKIRPLLEFHVFDRPDIDECFEERNHHTEMLADRFVNEDNLTIVVHKVCLNDGHMKELHADAVQRGYEGLMLRNMSGMYESGKRSADLQKYKTFVDAEFRVIGHRRDKDNLVVYICLNDVNDHEFSVILGTKEERANPVEADWLNVKFQSRYKDTLLPQFPVGQYFRACDANGNPIE